MALEKVLICDDEKNMRRVLEDILSDDGWDVESVETGEKAIERVRDGQDYTAIVIDLSLPGINGLETIEKLAEIGHNAGIVVITAYGSIDAAVQAMRSGAVDFLIKPFDNARIRGALRKIRESRGMLDAAELTHPTMVGAGKEPLNIIGSSPEMAGILQTVQKIASLKTNVLITGESGTGKEMVAQAIHYNGARRDMPFVPINCAALPETLLESELFGHERGAFTGAHAMTRGKFEVADHGTLFLDEIGDMPINLQVKLLRVLQEQKFTRVGGEKEISVDVRVIAATNRDMEEAVRLKIFREDLYYRLNVIEFKLPPLRERTADIPQLVEHFLSKFARRHHLPRLTLDQEQMRTLASYAWPGNIRELQNAAEKATVLQDSNVLVMAARNQVGASAPDGPEIKVNPDDQYVVQLGEQGSVRPLSEVAADAQRAAVIRALRICEGNKSEAAKKLNISYKTLFNKIDDLKIQISTSVS